MLHIQGAQKQSCNLLAVYCGKVVENEVNDNLVDEKSARYPFPDLVSSGHLELKDFRKFYEAYVPMKYKDYLKKMKRQGEWGDHLTLQAAADRFGGKICLVTSFRDTCYIEILPKDNNPIRVPSLQLKEAQWLGPLNMSNYFEEVCASIGGWE